MKARSRAVVAFLFTLSILLPSPSIAQSPATATEANGMSASPETWNSGVLLRWPSTNRAEGIDAADAWAPPHATIRVLRSNPPGTDGLIYVIDGSRNVLSVLDSNWAVVATFDGPRTDPDAMSTDPPDIPYFGRANLATAADRDLWTGIAHA
jgi:hypothetical protein